jgi:SAM-dependent methyltransferase
MDDRSREGALDRSERKTHWEAVFETKAPTELSWYQEHPERSLELIRLTDARPRSEIIDVGGGDSTLVDALLERGMHHVTVLDISAAALRRAKRRLADRAASVRWIEADVTRAQLAPLTYDVWHDRAVFHFLTDAEDRARYVEVVRQAVKVGGHVIVATFAPDGPTRCSGLEVLRYSPDALHGEFGTEFELTVSTEESHLTPTGGSQHFIYCLCRRR